MTRPLPEGIPHEVTIRKRNGRWYAAVAYWKPPAELPKRETQSVGGVDVGMNPLAPELVTPARERESQMSGETITLPFLVQVDLLDDQYRVSIGLENVKFVLGDEVARKVRKDMNKLDAQRDVDRREERRATAAARRTEDGED